MNISDDHAPLIIRALEHYADFLKATNRDDRLPRDLSAEFKRKRPQVEDSERVAKTTGTRRQG